MDTANALLEDLALLMQCGLQLVGVWLDRSALTQDTAEDRRQDALRALVRSFHARVRQ